MACSASVTTLVLVILGASSLVTSSPTCGGHQATQWLADPNDCSKFYLCHGRQRFDFNCGQNVWDPDTKTCVGRGSQWDKCTIAQELDALNGLGSSDTCANSATAVLAKADNCAQYYDCSSREATVANDPHVRECEFPLLFNAESKRCENYDAVKCGARPEPKDACEYVANQCTRSSHCVPCNARFPSCKGLPDGLNPWVGREYSPFFVLCENERSLYHGKCDNSRGTQLFDPVKRVCAEMKPESEM